MRCFKQVKDSNPHLYLLCRCALEGSFHYSYSCGWVGAMFPGVMPGLSPYWNGTSSPYGRPPVNMYGNPGMMAFNVPVSPFGLPAYVPSVYCGLPVNG